MSAPPLGITEANILCGTGLVTGEQRERQRLAVCTGRRAKPETDWYCLRVSGIISTRSQAKEMAGLSTSAILRQAPETASHGP